MKKRIEEIRNCLDSELYEAALALALTLPDICGQVEYSSNASVGQRYTTWIDNFVDAHAFYDSIFDEFGDFQHLKSQDIYKLRCSFLHSGDLQVENTNIDYFSLVKPNSLGTTQDKTPYGYTYELEVQPDGSKKHVARIDIAYLVKILCDSAETYYNSKNPEKFVDYMFELE